MKSIGYRASKKHYLRVFVPWMTAYVVLAFAGPIFLSLFEERPVWLRLAIAVVSALPILVVFRWMLWFFENTDEFIRLQQLRAFAEGAAIVMSVATVLGFLQIFQVIESIPVFFLVPGFFAAYGTCFFARNGIRQ